MPVDNYKKLKIKLTKFINAETYYNYAKMAMQLRENSDEYSLKIHGVRAVEAFNIADAVFGKKVGYTDNIESFLKNIQTVEGYNLKVEQKKKQEVK